MRVAKTLASVILTVSAGALLISTSGVSVAADEPRYQSDPRLGAYAAATVLRAEELLTEHHDDYEGALRRLRSAAAEAADEVGRSGRRERGQAEALAEAAARVAATPASEKAQVALDAQRLADDATQLVARFIQGTPLSHEPIDVSAAPELRAALTHHDGSGPVMVCSVLPGRCNEVGHGMGAESTADLGAGLAVPALPDTAARTPSCDTSTNAYRIRVIYGYFSSPGNRTSTFLNTVRTMAAETEEIVLKSAQQQGGTRKPRFVMNSDCSLAVSGIWLPDSAKPRTQAGYDAMRAALANAGYTNTRGKYLVFVDNANTTNGACGYGTAYNDATADPARQQANGVSSSVGYAAVYQACWSSGTTSNFNGGYTAAHELGHVLGAVVTSAPYATAGFHCFDGFDNICYNDGTAGGSSHSGSKCSDGVNRYRWDCGKDTYFARTPQSTWLQNNWNLYNSYFLGVF